MLVVAPDSPIKQLADLKGRRVGGISPTCEAVISITSAAKKAGGNFLPEKLAGGPAIALKYTGAPEDAIRHGNHRLKFTTQLDVPGLGALAAQDNIKETPGTRIFSVRRSFRCLEKHDFHAKPRSREERRS